MNMESITPHHLYHTSFIIHALPTDKKEEYMSEATGKKHSVKQVFITQAIASFVIIGLIIVLGAFLVFNEMGKEYSQFTVVGFIATFYIVFITLQPAGTLFAARTELIKGTVTIGENERTGSPGPLKNPWRQTVPLGLPVAALCTLIVVALVYGTGWKPSPMITAIIALLYVIPYFLITKRYIASDLESLEAAGPFSGEPVASKTGYFWSSYILPNIFLQFIINGAIANRGFSHASAELQHAYPDVIGMVPTVAMSLDFAVTFIFVCNFTFLATTTYTLSDMYRGRYPYEGRARGIHGFLFFLIMLGMGIAIGVMFALISQTLGFKIVSFPMAMTWKFVIVFISVYLGARFAMGWTGRRFNDAVAEMS
jgi:hypothetical protein